MVVFAELGAFDVLRAMLAVFVAGFLPGLFAYAAIVRAKNPLHLLRDSFFETVCVAGVVSAMLLSFAAMLLTFTIGFSAVGIAVLEAIVLLGCWATWNKKAN